MTKSEFIKKLDRKLNNKLDSEEKSKTILYYSELIDDHIENGLKEEVAVEKMGNIDSIVQECLENSTTSVNLTFKKSDLNIFFIILGLPILIPLAASILALVLAAFILIWCGVLVLLVFEVSIAFVGVSNILYMFLNIQTNLYASFFSLALVLISFGLFILLIKPLKLLIIKTYKFTCYIFNQIKEIIINKRVKTNE